METVDLIQTLARDTKPARRLRPLSVRLVVWAAVSLVIVSVWIVVFGVRPDLSPKLGELRFIVEGLLLLTGGIFSALISLVLGIPDNDRKLALKVSALIPVTAWFTLLIVVLIHNFTHGEANALSAGLGVNCVRDIFLIGMGPALFLFYLVRRASPTEPALTGALVLISMTCIGALGTHFLCKNDRALHLIVWHFLPIIVLALAGLSLGRRLLRW